MTESEYNLAGNLARVRAARALISECCALDSSTLEHERRKAYMHLERVERALTERASKAITNE